MKKSKLVLWLLLTSVTVSGAAFVHFTLESPTTNYPTRNIQGIIMWGAGGATDTMSRAITPYVEPQLNKEIVLINRSGGAGAISTKYVHNKKLVLKTRNSTVYWGFRISITVNFTL